MVRSKYIGRNIWDESEIQGCPDQVIFVSVVTYFIVVMHQRVCAYVLLTYRLFVKEKDHAMTGYYP